MADARAEGLAEGKAEGKTEGLAEGIAIGTEQGERAKALAIATSLLENGGQLGAPFREGGSRVAFKTGTSFGFRDAWAIGVSDRYTACVWVGRPYGTPNPGDFGANTAAPLVKDLLAAGAGRTQHRPGALQTTSHRLDAGADRAVPGQAGVALELTAQGSTEPPPN